MRIFKDEALRAVQDVLEISAAALRSYHVISGSAPPLCHRTINFRLEEAARERAARWCTTRGDITAVIMGCAAD